MQDRVVRLKAPAKVNLALAVGPAGLIADDPRHLICSWMLAVDLVDDLTLTPLDEGFFSRYAILWAADARRKTDIDWSITKDLAVRAHLLLEAEFGRKLAVQLKLEKRIPVGAGLGGGSSDAAAMLVGCNRLFELGLADDDLRRLGARLGSDVPFFVDGVSALAEGFGERLAPVPPPASLALVLVFPEVFCGTPEVYRSFDALHTARDRLPARFSVQIERVRTLIRAVAEEGARLQDADLFNDLAPAAFARYPDLSDVAREVRDISEREVHLSGSGSAMFVVCDDPMHAEHLAQAIEGDLGLAALTVGGWRGRAM